MSRAESYGLSPSAERVQLALDAAGIALHVRELSQSTRTAQDAALTIGREVGQIVKSLIFRDVNSGGAVLILACGSNRVDVPKVSAAIGHKLSKADADFVQERTGFAIGGVPPVGHSSAIETYVDSELMNYGVIWAAAGTPRAVFSLTPQQLLQLTGAKVIGIC
ncbi:MAG: YbaK/EbsC family protein [Caldilineaceae bacterium]